MQISSTSKDKDNLYINSERKRYGSIYRIYLNLLHPNILGGYRRMLNIEDIRRIL
ncbi:MAG: hypothetical protein AAF630_09555 [Cyanobacteria bacterium P01_C01_bin.38]